VILFCILGGNWEKLESGLRALVIEKNLDVEVYTGDEICEYPIMQIYAIYII
jgi:hypothetical protein